MIIVDTREPRGIAEKLKRKGIEVVFDTLEAGDYVVKHSDVQIAIERKTAEDYIASIEDGRLSKQLYLLSHHYKLSYIVLIGYISIALVYRQFNKDAYISSLIGVSLKKAKTGMQGQVISVNLETDYDFITFLKLLHEKVVKGDFERVPVSHKPPTKLLIGVYTMFPSIGLARAKKLYQKYDTLESLMKASLPELQVILGRKIGERVYMFLHQNNERE